MGWTKIKPCRSSSAGSGPARPRYIRHLPALLPESRPPRVRGTALGFDAHEEEQSRLLREALKRADITPGDLWLNYFSIGGAVGEYEVQAYLQGLLSLPPLQRDLLACAANELIDDLPRPRAPYSDDFDSMPDPGPAASEVREDGPGRQSDPDD